MAAGDGNLDVCPVCKADNRYTSMERYTKLDAIPKECFMVRCNKCGFAAPAGDNRDEARLFWNKYQRMDRDVLESWIDTAVMSFITDMKYKLRLNNHKGYWRNYNLKYLLDKLEGEVAELKKASQVWSVSNKVDHAKLIDIIHECADIANFALMIADNMKHVMKELDDAPNGVYPSGHAA